MSSPCRARVAANCDAGRDGGLSCAGTAEPAWLRKYASISLPPVSARLSCCFCYCCMRRGVERCTCVTVAPSAAWPRCDRRKTHTDALRQLTLTLRVLPPLLRPHPDA